jgi:hypothetical protein
VVCVLLNRTHAHHKHKHTQRETHARARARAHTHTHIHIFFFSQGALAFAPTYKFNPDSEEYSGGGKGRVRHVCVSV